MAEYNHTPSISSYQLATSINKDSLESSGSSSSSDHLEDKKYTIDLKLIDEKAKQLSLDSAYTSEADLDASHNSTATNSRAASPKLATVVKKAEENKMAAEEGEDKEKEDKKPESDGKEAKEKGEEEQVKAKPESITKEFVPKEVNLSPAPLSPPGMLFQQPSPQAYYSLSPPQYISPPLSPLAIQVQQQQQPCFTFMPGQEFPQAQMMPVGSTIIQQRQM